MKTVLSLVLVLKSLLLVAQPFGERLSIRAEAQVQISPPQIVLSWPLHANANEYTIFRKLKGETSWGNVIATLPGSATSYTDLSVTNNTLYEYFIYMSPTSGEVRRGYICSGIEYQANSNYGIAIIVVESSHTSQSAFQEALDTFVEDIELSGWYPKLLFVNKTDDVISVKNEITSIYNENPNQTELLVLVGNVPVPYSGNLNPDGHNDHQGAWPTDTYYADMDGNWTDVSVNNTSSTNPLNHNIPGDGKFDQSTIASDLELQVGRIDLSDLPTFSESETELLIKYFNKNHLYKIAEIAVENKALIDDNFTSIAEGFSQNGYNNFAPLVGRDETYASDYFTHLSYNTSTSGTYLWSYGCGPGTYTNCGGVGNSNDFSNDSLSTIFTMLFGSYFGDWNYTNGLLRAPLAQGNTLTNCWAGRPNWHFIHMGMGLNIGYSTRLSQNNSTHYFPSTLGGGVARLVSTNLMGDPSLKMTYIPMPTNLSVIEGGDFNEIHWNASLNGNEIGYNVYRRYTDSVDFIKLNASPISSTSFIDTTMPIAGNLYYYVKAVEMKTTFSGIHENESLGLKGSANSSVGIQDLIFEDLKLYPNPASMSLTIEVSKNLLNRNIQFYDLHGKEVKKCTLDNLKTTIGVDALPAGVYIVSIEQSSIRKRFVKY